MNFNVSLGPTCSVNGRSRSHESHSDRFALHTLLRKGCDVDQVKVCLEMNPEMAKVKDNKNLLPLQIVLGADENDQCSLSQVDTEDIVKLLIEYNADAAAEYSYSVEHPLNLGLRRTLSLETIKALYNAFPAVVSTADHLPLHVAVESNVSHGRY